MHNHAARMEVTPHFHQLYQLRDIRSYSVLRTASGQPLAFLQITKRSNNIKPNLAYAAQGLLPVAFATSLVILNTKDVHFVHLKLLHASDLLMKLITKVSIQGLKKQHSSFPKELTHHQLHAQIMRASYPVGQGAFWSGAGGSWHVRSSSGLTTFLYAARFSITCYIHTSTPTYSMRTHFLFND